MAANRGTTSEPVPLTAQITHVEKRILDRQRLIKRYATSCGHDLWNSLTSPPMLLSAVGMGFLVGILTRRQSPALPNRVAAGPRARRLLDSVLKSIALIRTLFPTLRWTALWPFPQADVSSCYAESQPRPTPRSSGQTHDGSSRRGVGA